MTSPDVEVLGPDVECVRLLQCWDCKSMEVLPDYPPTGHPDQDVHLHYLHERHGGHTESPHTCALHRVAKAAWEDRAANKQIVAGMWAETTGFTPSYYDAKDTLKEDAAKCFIAHHRSVPCLDYMDSSKKIRPPTSSAREKLARELPRSFRGDRDAIAHGGPNQYLCYFCLSGDTEVVTRDGLLAIDSLVGKPVELLVPVDTRWGPGTAARGSFRQAEVRYFGDQELWALEMRRGPKTKRVVRATAEHRWFTRDGEKTTQDLCAGDRLLPIKATPPRERELPVRFLMAQGVVYGDGSHGHHDKRPASLPIYDVGKHAGVIDLFQGHIVGYQTNGRIDVRQLPREWKMVRPSLRQESRSGLLSWLAGYFAADGTVGASGAATLSSARVSDLEYVRSLGAVCGVTVGPIGSRLRKGTGEIATLLYTVSIDALCLPDWFWLIDSHRERVATRMLGNVRHHGDRDWVVSSVMATGVVEPVYCGVVEGVGAFGLADDLLTGNCPVQVAVEHAKRVSRGEA